MREIRRFCGIPLFMILLIALGSWSIASAQSTTATLKGTVMSDQGTAVAGAMIVATNVANGFKRDTTAYNDGTYSLTGLPPGTYDIQVSSEAYTQKTQKLTVQVGQNLNLDFKMAPSQVVTENITVVGSQVIETRTSEAATNVTPQQIENLPQAERNFLNFAALAPGIRLSNDPQRKTIAGDAQPAEQTNVFIDGVSMKNDVLQGGVAGQDSSRGNLFPQNAVQEFRVITQNYSAQYDKASSAIITAVTKSGGNAFDGQVFAFYQPNSWVSKLPSGFQFSTLATNQDFRRYQTGLNIGGPIIKDALNYFVAYEGDNQHATTGVSIGGPAANVQRFGSNVVGVFSSPFKSTLGFGKVSWQPGASMLLDLSANYRHEDEIRDFGGQTSFQSATSLKNYTSGATLRDQWNSNTSLNQATLSLQKYGWNPTPTNPNLVGLNYEGAVRLGGNSTTQKFDQRRLELRDDYNFAGFNWAGQHSLQVGGNADFLHYSVNKSLNGNPQYNFRIDPANGLTYDQPYEANFGFGNPIFTTSNREYGLYGQDTWAINSNVTLNLGLRWDYETHMLDENYVTPANVVAALTGKTFGAGSVQIPSADYFSTGSQRKPAKDEFQPRIGFNYDLRGDSKSVLFAGAGRYYDRLFLNATLDERFRLQYPVYRIEFSPDGKPRFGGSTIMWDPKYLTPDGLHALIASGATRPELYMLNNNTKVPYSDQFNLGFRQALGSWLGSLSVNTVHGKHGFTWLSASGLCCSALVPGLGNVIISDPEGKEYWYNALFLSLDRPYTTQNGWGAHVAWTHGRAQQTGNDLFSLDFPSAATYPKHDVPGSERDRIVASGIFGLPFDVRFSTIVSLGSGGATNLLDFSKGFSLQNRIDSRAYAGTLYPPKTWGFADRSVDLRLEKTFRLMGSSSIGLIAEGFNVFNWHNYGCIDNFLGPDGNSNLGKANCLVNLGRRLQAGVRVGF
jgi:Carboxypeptidase regulatory-like domain/TonB dependent receptor